MADRRSAQAQRPLFVFFERPPHVVHAGFDRFVAAEDADGDDVVLVDADLDFLPPDLAVINRSSGAGFLRIKLLRRASNTCMPLKTFDAMREPIQHV